MTRGTDRLQLCGPVVCYVNRSKSIGSASAPMSKVASMHDAIADLVRDGEVTARIRPTGTAPSRSVDYGEYC